VTGALVLLALVGSPSDAGAAARTVGRQEILQAMREKPGLRPYRDRERGALPVRGVAAPGASGPPARSHAVAAVHRSPGVVRGAYLERTGLSAEGAPLFVRLAYDHAQDMEVDYRRERVVEAVEPGPPPELALNVCIWRPEASDGPRQYSYEDLLSSPRFKVTNERLLSYRLLDFGDMTGFAGIRGLRGRPTSGILGLPFQLIGEAHVEENRMAVSEDDLQVSRARSPSE
jgi:hypothetical protein